MGIISIGGRGRKLGRDDIYVDAAYLKTILRGDSCRVYNSGNLSINNNTWTDLTFDSERWDVGGMHSVAANTQRITVTEPGIYMVTGHISWAANATGLRGISIYLNNTTYIALELLDNVGDGSNVTAQSIATLYQFSATDYVTLRVFQNSGGALNVTATGNYSPEFGAARIL